jgi:hypothetical protein
MANMNMLMITAESADIGLKLKTQPVALLLIAMFISVGANPASAAAVEHGLPQQAIEIAKPLGFPITNSMVATWIVAASAHAALAHPLAQLQVKRQRQPRFGRR